MALDTARVGRSRLPRGRGRPAALRLLRRAHGPLRLHRHLRAGPPDGRRARLPRRRARADPRAGRHVVRYPGGNFVSGYRWEDGVGPRDERPAAARPGLALDRDQRVRARRVHGLGGAGRRRADDGGQPRHPRLAGGLRPARVLQPPGRHRTVGPAPSPTARKEPYGIRLWCLGNEMDGPWQIGHKTADEYGRLAAETARAMRQVDPARAGRLRQLELADADLRRAGRRRPRATPTTTSTTSRCTPTTRSSTATSQLPGLAVDMDRFIEAVVATADHVGARLQAAQADQHLVRRVERLVPVPLRRRADQLRLGRGARG